MPMQMRVRMLMGVFVGMAFFPMPVFMAVRMGMLMDMQMLVFRYVAHNNLAEKTVILP